MPDVYAIDSCVYIPALRNADELAALKQFLRVGRSRIVIAGVVAMELRAGASTPEHVNAVEALLAPYALRNRVFGVSYAAHQEAGRVLSALVARERVGLAQAPRSLTADVLLATSCRERDIVLITNNNRDFSAIQRQLRGFRFVPPWPTGPSALR
ncbi:MAG: type II toxin-antitoxin system VapC family toxin [bacterium]